jgi:uncharacterized SAM-binding protein YcdF (DUF218 family)
MIGRTAAIRWVLAGLALELCWLFAQEGWRDKDATLLAILVMGPGVLAAAAWHAVLRPTSVRTALIGAGLLAVALAGVDLLLDLVTRYKDVFAFPRWELLRGASIVAGIGGMAWLARARTLPRTWNVVARVLLVLSIAASLIVPGAMTYLAIAGSRDAGDRADAALVLGSYLAPDGSPLPSMIGRVEHAVALYKSGRVRRLVLSGGVAKGGHTEARAMHDLALAAGVPESAMILEEDSRSTIENFACSRALFEKLDIKTVLLVTEPWHMTRAMLLANRHGLFPQQSPASSATWRNPRDGAYWLFRDAVAFVRERVRQFYASPGVCKARVCDGCRTF